MAHWHHLFGLLSVVCISFGALFLIFNSDFGEVCDYSKVVESCSELKTYIPDIRKDNQSFAHEFKVQAHFYRNESETEKCAIEEDLQMELLKDERDEAARIINSCMTSFRQCVAGQYTTPTTTTLAVDCTLCNRFCLSTRWIDVNPAYAALMGGSGYGGACTEDVCPWQPQCNTIPDSYFPEPPTGVCRAPCNCKAALCATTTTTGTTSTSTSASTTSTTSTTTTADTTVTTTTTTTSTTTTTTVTATTLTTSTTTTTTTATTTTSTGGCQCAAGEAATVLVGPPMSAFNDEPAWTYAKMLYYQGVVVETDISLYEGQSVVYECRNYFSDRDRYYGLRGSTPSHINSSLGMAAGSYNARHAHPDLGCGYAGTFTVDCVRMSGTCGLNTSVKSCIPPTYTQAVTDCLSGTTTTTQLTGSVTAPAVPDWLTVEELPYEIAEILQFSITTTTTSEGEATCCEAHVASVCNTGVNFDSTFNVGPTVNGSWQPNLSFIGQTGYFPTVPCGDQAKWQPVRACPSVKIKELSNAQSTYNLYPNCQPLCNLAKVMQEWNNSAVCNKTRLQEKGEAAHQKKIDSMKDKHALLKTWTRERMRTVHHAVTVTDCIGDTLPRRYNGMGLPSFRSGYEKLPLHKECRLHRCEHKQCLKVTRPCRVPFLETFPEQNCGDNIYAPSFKCEDKVGINSNDPMSVGFTIAWMIIGSIFLCASIAAYIRNYSREQESQRTRPPLVTETAITKFGAT